MAGINTGKLIAGGLAAGLVINIIEATVYGWLMADQLNAALATLNLDPPGGGAIAGFITMGFVIGLILVWVYAGIRPRFGPGPKTAAMAALAVWAVGYVIPFVAQYLQGMVPLNLLLISSIVGLVETVGAVLVGAKLYQEAA